MELQLKLLSPGDFFNIILICILGTTPASNAGAIWSAGPAEFINCKFEMNAVPASGGAVRCQANIVLFDNCEFDTNTSGGIGGAVAMRLNGVLTIKDCQFTGNTSSSSGNAIALHDASLHLVGTNFFDPAPDQNIYGESGSALIMDAETVVTTGGALSITLVP